MKRLSKNNQQNHIQYDHQYLYCDNVDKYITQLSKKKDHEKTCIKFRKCYKNFKSITKIRKHKKISLSKYYKKIYQAESTDESGSLSFKSRYKNKKMLIFNIPVW